MARARANEQSTRNWTMLALLIGGIGLLAVEMSAGMDYVQASLKHEMVDFLDCIPALGVTALNFAQKAFWSCGSVESVLRVMPMVTLPFVLVGVGLALGRRTTR
jgi:hypothetical protein